MPVNIVLKNVKSLFNMLKNDLGFTRALVKTDETLQGKVFCVMIAVMIVSYIRRKMREAKENGKITRKLTYKKTVHELECVYTYKTGNKTVWSEISDRQSTIFKFLEIELPAKPKNIKVKKTKIKNKPIS